MSRSSHVRYSIVLLTTVIMGLYYTDRTALAVAAPFFQKELGFEPARMGLILGIFSLPYAIGQTPWGMAADRLGSRLMICGCILAWACFTTFTGMARTFAALCAARFALGSIEASLVPSTGRIFLRWTRVTERSTAFGVFQGGGRVGAALTPSLAVFLILRYGWRTMFAMLGMMGIPAALIWLWWFRDDPATHAAVNPEERELLASTGAAPVAAQRTAWSSLLRSSRLWNMLAVSFTVAFMWQFYITWFPTYLLQKRGLPIQEAAFYAGLPFLFGVAGAWSGGIATDFLARRLGVHRARFWVGFAGISLTATLMLVGTILPYSRLGALFMAAAAFTADLYIGPIWASAVEIGGPAAGAVGGLNNAMANCGAFASPVLMGMILQRHGNWNTLLLAGVCATYLAAYLWTRVNPVEKQNTPS